VWFLSHFNAAPVIHWHLNYYGTGVAYSAPPNLLAGGEGNIPFKEPHPFQPFKLRSLTLHNIKETTGKITKKSPGLVASFDLWPREKKFQKKTWQAEEKNYMLKR